MCVCLFFVYLCINTHRFRSALLGLQQFLAAAWCLCDTFSGVLMLESRLTAKQAVEPSAPPRCQETVMDGWTVTQGGGGVGVRRR